MTTYQKFNKRLDRWVGYKETRTGKSIIVNVKQRNPLKPFKGVKIRK